MLTFEGGPPGPGRAALDRAMADLHARERATAGLRVAGGTDRALARAMLQRQGLPDDDDAIDRVLARYLQHLEASLTTRRYLPVGDVAGAVVALRARGSVVGVATGNMRRGAQLKLTSAGLAASFDLALGGYGCDAEPRAAIVRIAAERCAAARGASGAQAIVVVGDTVHDVRAGRAVGARVVGVAMDDEARAELEEAGADAIVAACGDDLGDRHPRGLIPFLPGPVRPDFPDGACGRAGAHASVKGHRRCEGSRPPRAPYSSPHAAKRPPRAPTRRCPTWAQRSRRRRARGPRSPGRRRRRGARRTSSAGRRTRISR